ncbi:hypothetical protein [Xanthomarina spongicola]|uniref:Uncharacterized protein n=1 Tax=Xanthomarina spongicola TaxID=570520 RepID=A0A316DRU5_9FLAO|nr:hypothetical protein [Xanthomarina spongicola]PWK19889.1 hypothetical protein LX78_01239 [Xanthomarina spongicola]
MNRIVLCFILLIFISFSTKSQESGKEIASTEVNLPLNPFETITYKEPYSPHSPYHLDLKIENTETDSKQLVVFITLKGDSYFVSPHAKKDFKGRFSMTLDESSNLATQGHIIEIPQSVEEIDTHHLVDGTVNWVKENTTYKLPLNVNTDKDFEATGAIRFTIEPRCTFEEIPFMISQKSGKLSVKLIGGC